MAAMVVEIFWNSVVGWFYIYGTWLYASELLFCAVPVAAIGSIILFIAINFLRIPPPDALSVEEIFGPDPGIEEVENNESSERGKYTMKVVAHRGAGLDAPENSMTAIRKTKEKGCTAVEIDVALTADDVPIIFHDSDVDRLTESTGQISELTWAELKELDISEKHPFREKFTGEKIVGFEEAVAECLKLGLRIFLDLKGDDTKLVSVVLEAFNKNDALYTRAVVSSFNPLLIYLIRRSNPRIVCSLAWRPHYFTSQSYSGAMGEGRPHHKGLPLHLAARAADLASSWAFRHLTFYLLGLSAVLLHKDIVTAEAVEYWRTRNVRVVPWTVNLPSEKQYFSRVLKVAYMTDTLDDHTS